MPPALAALLPNVVPGKKLAAANSLVHMSSQAATLIGQAAGGLAFTWVGAAGLVLFDGLTFVFSAVCAAFAKAPSPAPRIRAGLRESARSYLQDMSEGFEWLSRHPGLRSLIVAFAAVNFLFTPVFVLLPVYVKDALREGPEWCFSRGCRTSSEAESSRSPWPWPVWRSQQLEIAGQVALE